MKLGEESLVSDSESGLVTLREEADGYLTGHDNPLTSAG